jgi:flagellar protein FlbD
MIELTRLSGERFYLNPELIETLEGEKNTIVTLTTKKKLVVKETPKEVRNLFLMYKRAISTRMGQGLLKEG